jgi:two-component system LytT family response regulator
MKKIRCLLVDDEPLAIALLKQHIAQLDMLEIAADCPTALQALEVLRTKDIDLLFLDIRMPALDGLELLKMLRHPPKVIITTAYRDYALDGYDLDIVDYLLKPITFDRFVKAAERAIRQLRSAAAPAGPSANSPSPGEISILYIKSGYRNVRLHRDAILYLESCKDYVKIHTAAEIITSKSKLGEMEVQLGAAHFLRIHRSFIINLGQVTAFTASQVELGSIQLPIGESYKELVMQRIRRRGDKLPE